MTFVWTDEAKELAARSALAVEAVRRGHLTGEEALVSVILGKPDTPEYMARIEAKIAEIAFSTVESRDGGPPLTKEDHRARERERYHTDDAYRERVLVRHRERRQTPEFKAKERERARKRRAARKEEKSNA